MTVPAPVPDMPALFEVEDALRSGGVGMGAAEFHGAVCGWVAGGGATDGRDWLSRVTADPAAEPPAAGSVLDRLRAASVAQLEDREFGFDLLLADASASLGERSESLFEWCRGFLGGFGLATGARPPLSEEGQEALADLARLATATAQDEGDEEDEDALAEIEEFVRVAALLLYGDCALGLRHRNQLH